VPTRSEGRILSRLFIVTKTTEINRDGRDERDLKELAKQTEIFKDAGLTQEASKCSAARCAFAATGRSVLRPYKNTRFA